MKIFVTTASGNNRSPIDNREWYEIIEITDAVELATRYDTGFLFEKNSYWQNAPTERIIACFGVNVEQALKIKQCEWRVILPDSYLY